MTHTHTEGVTVTHTERIMVTHTEGNGDTHSGYYIPSWVDPPTTYTVSESLCLASKTI